MSGLKFLYWACILPTLFFCWNQFFSSFCYSLMLNHHVCSCFMVSIFRPWTIKQLVSFILPIFLLCRLCYAHNLVGEDYFIVTAIQQLNLLQDRWLFLLNILYLLVGGRVRLEVWTAKLILLKAILFPSPTTLNRLVAYLWFKIEFPFLWLPSKNISLFEAGNKL